MRAKIFAAVAIITMIMAIAATVAFAQDQVSRQGVVDLAGGLKEEAQKRQELAKDVEDLKNRPPTVQTRVTGLSEIQARKLFLEVGGLAHVDQLYFNLRLLGFASDQAKIEIGKYLALKGEIKSKERVELIESWLKKGDFATKKDIDTEKEAREKADIELENKIPTTDKISQAIVDALKEDGFVQRPELDSKLELKANADQVSDLQTKVDNLGEKVDTKADKAEVENFKTDLETTIENKTGEAKAIAEGTRAIADATAGALVQHIVEGKNSHQEKVGGFLFWGGRRVSREQLKNFRKSLENQGLDFWGRVPKDRQKEVRKFLGEKALEPEEEPEEKPEEEPAEEEPKEEPEE